MIDDKRLIEDYLPIAAINAEASREKSVCGGRGNGLKLRGQVGRPVLEKLGMQGRRECGGCTT